jgi:hypothetical protein
MPPGVSIAQPGLLMHPSLTGGHYPTIHVEMSNGPNPA